MRPSRVSTILTARGTAAAISPRTRASAVAIEQVGLVEHDEIGAQELVLVDLLQRVVVVERRVGGALARELFGIVGEAAGRDRRRIDHRDRRRRP